MSFNIHISKNSDTPIYRQIIEQITLMVKNGTLKAGDKLPSERELANAIQISRGTITKAYEELERNNIIEVTQGSGSFVSKGQDIMDDARKEQAIRLIGKLLRQLEEFNFSYREIRTLMEIILMEREKQMGRVHIAAVDCNPEALAIFKKQLGYITNAEFSKFLLDDLKGLEKPEERLGNYDIILTTSTHYRELTGILPGLKEKIIQAAVSPSRQTIIDIATTTEHATIGIVSQSQQFRTIIQNTLKAFQIKKENISHAFENEDKKVKALLREKDILIIPPDWTVEAKYQAEFSSFKKREGRIIPFNYQMERGSLIYIEEQISEILNRK